MLIPPSSSHTCAGTVYLKKIYETTTVWSRDGSVEGNCPLSPTCSALSTSPPHIKLGTSCRMSLEEDGGDFLPKLVVFDLGKDFLV